VKRDCVYVIATPTTKNVPTPENPNNQVIQYASGWMDIEAVDELYRNDVKAMQAIPTREPERPASYSQCRISGGDRTKYEVGGKKLRVRPCVAEKGAERAEDYLGRTRDPNTKKDFVNLLYSLPHHGGISCDTFPVDTPFYALKPPQNPLPVNIPLYEPMSERQARIGGRPAFLRFVYGYVEIKTGEPSPNEFRREYGWIANEAIDCSPPPPP
jgi:hypothetical protein